MSERRLEDIEYFDPSTDNIEPVSRRGFLSLAAIGTLGALSLLYRRELSDVFNDHMLTLEEERVLNTVVVIQDVKRKHETIFNASGFIVERNNNIQVATSLDVAKLSDNNPTEALIPTFSYKAVALELSHSDEELDPEANLCYYDLDEEGKRILWGLKNKKAITPITISERSPEKNQRVIIPDVYKQTHYDGIVYESTKNDFLIISPQESICRGRSGAPVLLYEKGKITNQSIGTIKDDPGVFCNKIITARINS